MQNICPISGKMVDENVVRFFSFLVLISILFGFFVSYWFFLFLSVNFLLRIYNKFASPFTHIASYVVYKLFKKEVKLIDEAPKIFAAWIGFCFSLTIFSLLYLGATFAAWILTGFFIFAVVLETLFNYCLGCKAYSLIQLIKQKARKK